MYVNITNFSKHQNPHKNEKLKGSLVPEFSESMMQAVDLLTLTINRDKNGTSTDNGEVNPAEFLKAVKQGIEQYGYGRYELVPIPRIDDITGEKTYSLGFEQIPPDWEDCRVYRENSDGRSGIKPLYVFDVE